MNHRTRTSRFALPSLAGVLGLVLAAGCQTGAQNDLVTRELRNQEDQIYAMEDYLAQYQQLLCQYRAENAALRRQVRECGAEPLPAPARRAAPPIEPAVPPRRNGPTFQSPGRTPPDQQQEAPPEGMEIEVIEPDVPALEETTANEPSFDVRGQNPPDSFDEQPGVAAAAYEGAAPAFAAAAYEGAAPASRADAPPYTVWLHGEVVANESGGGPRLVVEIVPLTAADEPARYEGALSLMVLKPTLEGPPRSLARWDFSADDVRTAADDSADGRSMRFHVELPADLPLDAPTELWVRLMPSDGTKLLADVPVNFQNSGRFSSRQVPPADVQTPAESIPAPHEPLVARAVSTSPISNQLPVSIATDDAGWTVARPDQPGQAPANTHEPVAQWRAATQPIPIATSVPATASSMPLPAKPPAVQQASFVETVTPAKISAPTPVARTAPAWTPERGNKTPVTATMPTGPTRSAAAPMRPTWSPLR